MRNYLHALLILFVACGTHKAPTSAAKSIGAAGGTITAGSVTLTVPAGALSTSQQITAMQVSDPVPSGFTGLSPIYQFGPDGLVFAQPVTVSIAMTTVGAQPTVYWSNSSGGYDAMATTVSGSTAQAQVSHFSRGFAADPPGDAKALTAFSLAGVQGTIARGDGDGFTIAVTAPAGTNLTSLAATFTTTGASVSVADTPQVSGTTLNDFSAPVTYTVTARNKSTATYVVTATVAAAEQGSAKAITTFSIGDAHGTINAADGTIAVTVPSGTKLTALVATFTTTGASVAIGDVAQVSGTTQNDFTEPKVYVVTAIDASTASYTVSVSVAAAAGGGPVVTYPAASGGIISPAVIQGTTTAGASVSVSIANGDAVIGTGSASANDAGVFNFTVTYTEPAATTALTITVNAGDVQATTVNVSQAALACAQFGVSQASGGATPDYAGLVYLQVFARPDDTLPLQTLMLDAPTSNFTTMSQVFRLPALSLQASPYFFLGFRDSLTANHAYDAGEPVTNAGTPIQASVFTQQGSTCSNTPSSSQALSLP